MLLSSLILEKVNSKDKGIIDVATELKIKPMYIRIFSSGKKINFPKNLNFLNRHRSMFLSILKPYSIITEFYFKDIKGIERNDGDMDQTVKLLLKLKKNDSPKYKLLVKSLSDYKKNRNILINTITKANKTLSNVYKKLHKNPKNKKYTDDIILIQQTISEIKSILGILPQAIDKFEVALRLSQNPDHRHSDSMHPADEGLVGKLKKVNRENFLVEKEMLDISITNADKVTNTDSKMKSFLADEYKVEEKFDGTKLTLWRNGEDWNEDYQKNWVVAFKNQILYGEEFEAVDRAKTKKHSVGISQYAFIHDHMKKIHKNTKSFPKNTEVFIEFIQNKLTTTRDYENKHGLYLIAYSPATGEIEGGMLKTKPSGFFQDKVEKYSKMLELNLPPVVFEGKLDSVSNITKGILNDKLKKAWNKNKDNYDENPYETVKQTFLEFESVLGGKTEGVVLHSKDGKMFKFLQSDQHDKGVRFAKKMRYQADPIIEKEYWNTIKELSNELLKDIDYSLDKLSYQDILKEFSKEVNSMSDVEIEKKFKFKFDAMRAEGKMK